MRNRRLFVLSLLALAGLAPFARAMELPCRHEDALAEAAAELLLRGAELKGTELLPEARAFGFDGVAVHAHDGQDEGALIQWLKSVGDRSDGPLVCGEARSETRHLVLVSARGGRLWRANGRLFGELAPGFSRPALVVEQLDGSTRRLSPGAAELRAGVLFPEDVAPRRVQLVAEGPHGPRPVSELLWVAEVARTAPPPPPVETPEGEAARGPRTRSVSMLAARLDGFRSRSGVGGLRQNDLLTSTAQRYAARVCELGRVAHQQDGSDDPETRLREDHVEARAVGEAVARASSADAALSAIFESPSHRMAVTERQFTDVGIGQAIDHRNNTCLVVLLAAWPKRLP